MSDLKRQIVEKGVKQILDEASVPLHVHLQVIKELKGRLDAHDTDRKHFQQVVLEAARNIKSHRDEIQTHHETTQHLLSVKEGRAGSRGKDGVGRDGRRGPAGRDGRSVNMDAVIERVLARMPQPKDGVDGQNAEFDEEKLFEKFVTALQKGKLLNASHIKGLSGWVKDGTKYSFEELMHGGGSASVPKSTDLSSQCNGSNKVFTIPTFTTLLSLVGSDAPIVYRPTTDFSGSGTTLTLTSAVNAPSSGATLILTYV